MKDFPTSLLLIVGSLLLATYFVVMEAYKWRQRKKLPEKVKPKNEVLKCPRCGAENPQVTLMPLSGVFRLDDFRKESTVMPSVTCRECAGDITLVFTLKEVRV